MTIQMKAAEQSLPCGVVFCAVQGGLAVEACHGMIVVIIQMKAIELFFSVMLFTILKIYDCG